jgi:cellulose synthase/poly-beta-1,6-N-acetylglucosamine synthase-like glycosyltransferase
VNAVLLALALAWILPVAVIVLVLLLEVLAGWKARGPAQAGATTPASYAVLVPAHDEAGTIAATLAAVMQQLPPAARVLVVADNCSDATAAEARAAGADVVERRDAVLRGKGYALAFGLEHLRKAPPEAVVILDADCIPAPGALDRLAAQALAMGRPVQGLYLMGARPGSSLSVRMAAFAWALKNQLRPQGLHRLGLPCQLMGSGMAFPWACIAAADLASGHLTEDLQLGLKLARAGSAPCFCPQARVDSWFPEGAPALQSQRRRWEHGHLSMILAQAPALLARGVRTGSAGALALGLDVCVPPLALLALMVLVSCAWGAWAASAGGAGQVAAAIAAGSALAFAAVVLLAWWRVGRQWVRFAELASAPVYVLRKLPVYASFVLRRQQEWVRTGRHP